MPTLKDDAICIRHWDWSETSQTVSVLTREHGIVRGLAKGSKRENARFSGGLELATRGELVAIVKQSDADHSLATLTSWDLLETFPGIGWSLAGFNAAMAMLDFVHHGLIERDPHPGVFDALAIGLRRLEQPREVTHATLCFAWALIDESGHRPELFQDPGSSALLGEAVLYGFDPRRGMLVPDPGDPSYSPLQAGDASTIWRVRGETVRVLRGLAEGSTLDPDACPPDAVTRALKLLCFYFRELAGIQPPAIRAMLEVLPTTPGS